MANIPFLNNAYFSAKVGIGTDSPDRKLHVKDSAIVVSEFEGTNTGSLLDLVNSNASQLYNGIRFTQGTSGKMAVTHIADGTTKGYVQIGNSWATGSEILVVDGRTSNVGIGTTSPSQKLEVSTSNYNVSKFVGNTDDGTGYVGAVVEIESNNDARGRGVYLTHRLSTDTTDSEWYAGVPYTGDGYSIGNAAYGTSINSDTGPAHKDQSKLFITEGGNVGIGTTSPGALLEISGIRENQIRLTSYDTTAAVDETIGGIEFYSSDTGNEGVKASISAIAANTEGSAYMTFSTGTNTEAMRIASAGGISFGSTGTAYGTSGQVLTSAGNASPTWATPTTGTVTGTGTTSRLTKFTDGPNGVIGNSGIQDASNAIAITINGNEEVGINKTNPTRPLHVSGIAQIDNGSLQLGGTSSVTGNNPQLRRTNSSNDLAISTGGSDRITVLGAGNVGIGTTSPIYKLVVSDNGAAGIEFGPEYAGNTNLIQHYDRISAAYMDVNHIAQNHRFGRGASEWMRITSTGNVGIGTTSPLNKTHIVGPTLATGTETSYGLAVSDVGDETKTLILGYDLVNDVGIIQAIDQQTAWKDLALGISGDTKVGVGEIAPTAKLHIKSPGNATLIRAYSAGYKAMDLWGATNGSQLTLHGGAEAATIVLDGRPGYNSYFTTGNVGIGTTTPDQKLHIKGGDIQTQDTTGSNGVLRIRATITGTPSTGGYPNVGAGDAVIEGGGTTQRRAGVITLMNGDSSISAGQDLGVIQFVGKDDASNGYCTSQIISTTSSAAGTGASGGGILRFLTASGNTGSAVEERMRINNSGRVMIGTTTATSNANLTVKDSLAIQNGSNTVLSIFTGYGSSFINTGTSGGTVNFGAPTSYTTNVYVQGTIKAASSVQMGNNTAAASSANAGSTRYRVSGNNSYMDMSMRTGATTYAWVNIVQNNW